jgi:hypothetical protein
MAGEIQLFKDMAEQIVSGSGISGAATLAADASPATKAAVIRHAKIILVTPGLPADLKDAAQKIINLLQLPAPQLKAAGKSNMKLYLLGGAGLAAVWFFFIRKK